MSWFTESNRWKHLLGGIVGITAGLIAVIWTASALEYKDKAHGCIWDWIDWWCTIAGGIIGQLVQLSIIMVV